MADPLADLRQRCRSDWLIIDNSQQLLLLAEQRFQELAPGGNTGPQPVVLLTEADPIRFLAGFIAACAARCPIFLGNAHWVEAEWQAILPLIQPDRVWGSSAGFPPNLHELMQAPQPNAERRSLPQPGWIMIPTGGSSGQIRFVIHTWATLTAAVRGFQQYFQVQSIHSCCVLPLYHVSGLMQFMRSFTSGGDFALLPFKSLEAGVFPRLDATRFFLSLVPTQLQRLLQIPQFGPWLAQFHTVFLGGAPAWADLLNQARRSQIRLAPTYGMTETAAQIATQQPNDFLAGRPGCGSILPHAQVSIHSAAGQVLGCNQVGAIAIAAESLALGYYGDRSTCTFFDPVGFQPDDLGFLDDQGQLHLVGRNSDKIITGGENVFPAEVEAAIWQTGWVADVVVIGVSDRHWGEVVTAFYVPKTPAVTVTLLQLALKDRLSKFKHPKQWIALDTLPRNAQGKINRVALQQIAGAIAIYGNTPIG